MKSDYNKVFDSLSKSKSLKAHFNALTKIHESTTDDHLKELLNKALSDMLDPKYLKDSSPIPLSKSNHSCITNLLNYCEIKKEKTKHKRRLQCCIL